MFICFISKIFPDSTRAVFFINQSRLRRRRTRQFKIFTSLLLFNQSEWDETRDRHCGHVWCLSTRLWREVKVTARLGSVYRYFGKLVFVPFRYFSIDIYRNIDIFDNTTMSSSDAARNMSQSTWSKQSCSIASDWSDQQWTVLRAGASRFSFCL